MTYKYGKDLAGIKDCPPKSNVETKNKGYRFIRTPTNHSSFLPVALINPKRFMNASDAKKCSSWALSMFISEQQATNFFKKLEITVKNARKTLGDHVAELDLTVNHGLQTNADQNGHFDLHEFCGVDLSNAISKVTIIP